MCLFLSWTGKKKAYTALLQWGTFLCWKKWGTQRKAFGGRYGFPGFYRVSVSATSLESNLVFLCGQKSSPKSFLLVVVMYAFFSLCWTIGAHEDDGPLSRYQPAHGDANLGGHWRPYSTFCKTNKQWLRELREHLELWSFPQKPAQTRWALKISKYWQLPSLVVSKLLVCIFFRERRSFAPSCALLRSFACFRIWLRLEWPRLGIPESSQSD